MKDLEHLTPDPGVRLATQSSFSLHHILQVGAVVAGLDTHINYR